MRFVLDGIQLHTSRNNLLNYVQHWYIPNRTIHTNLLSTQEELLSLWYVKIYADMVFPNLSKAFDMVNRWLFLAMLEKFFMFAASFLRNCPIRAQIKKLFFTWEVSLQESHTKCCLGASLILYLHKLCVCVHNVEVLLVREWKQNEKSLIDLFFALDKCIYFF